MFLLDMLVKFFFFFGPLLLSAAVAFAVGAWVVDQLQEFEQQVDEQALAVGQIMFGPHPDQPVDVPMPKPRSRSPIPEFDHG